MEQLLSKHEAHTVARLRRITIGIQASCRYNRSTASEPVKRTVHTSRRQDTFGSLGAAGRLRKDTFHFTQQAPSLNTSIYQYNAPKDPFLGLAPYDIASIVDQNAIPGTTLVSPVQQTGITATLSLSSIRSAFKGVSGAGQHLTGIELINSEVATVEQNEFERLEFGIRRYIGTSNTTDDIRSNTFTDNTYGLLYTGAYPAPGPVSSYNPRLNCNQFEKTTTGLPFAYGIYVDSTAGMEAIGGDGSSLFPGNPSGNGWVGLSPGNNGYAVWNHPSNVQLTYYKYDNELIDILNVFNSDPALSSQNATPYLNVLGQPNQNPTCFDNPSVYFLPKIVRNQNQLLESKSVFNNPTSGKEQIVIYPNPARNVVTLLFPLEMRSSEVQISVISGLGKEVKRVKALLDKSSSFELLIDDLQAGTYFLSVECGTETTRQVLIKN